MNITQIQENLQGLLTDVNKDTFVYDLLLAYNTPKASVTRLQKGSLNMSKVAGEISWKKKLLYKQIEEGDLHEAIGSLVQQIKHDQRFVIVTDFKNLLAIDTKTKENLDIPFTDLPKHYDFFLPWAGMEKANHLDENPADVKAAEKMAKLFDEIKKDNPDDSQEFVHGLNVFLSRLLFCFFAEDTHIFEENQFTNALESHTKLYAEHMHDWLDKFFLVLDTPKNKRTEVFGTVSGADNGVVSGVDKRTVSGVELPEHLNAFPYVNGGLFKQRIPAPKFTRRSRQLLIEAGTLSWAAINPDIFGSMFQAVISADQRGNLGQHYTSVPNIMKVIEPLFLNDLKEAAEKAKGNKKKVNELLHRLRTIKIFDPACGSGNFLIIAYKELRKLEMKIFKENGLMAISGISLSQFFGIELDDFAHEIAQLSLWLAEHQMNVEFFNEFGRTNPTLPLTEAGKIVQGNACRLDWEEVCPKGETEAERSRSEIYILGNPPYLGSTWQSPEQKDDLKIVFDGVKNFKKLDFITCWFYKGADYIKDSNSELAFVSTNSVTQGEHVPILWPSIFCKNIEIGFAHTSFKWTNNAKSQAAVICVIVNLRSVKSKKKYLFVDNKSIRSDNISPYLTSGTKTIVIPRSKPLSNLPQMSYGNKAVDGGYLFLTTEDRTKLLMSSPESKIFIKRILGSKEFINSMERWCLWIKDSDLPEALKIPEINSRIESVRSNRLNSKDIGAQTLAEKPHQFRDFKSAVNQSIIIPRVSSERRKYLVCGFLKSDTIISDRAQVIYDPPLYILSVLLSKIHMLFVNCVTGRLKMDINYSSSICYNTFPIMPISDQRKQEIIQCVFRILEERENHSDKTLAQLYDPDKMPEGLREAHHQNDLAIERCYRSKPFESDEERLEYLFKLYEKMIKEEKAKEGREKAEKKNKKTKQ
ncbi:MAG: N-6 DNA methylase [Salinivirgaceae bacterium]|jgi:hypothetical protein|nr:N-6 DNA methylase [Salinivirgaceae bacterium]